MFLSAAIFAMSIALVSSPARAQELQAMNNFHHEMAECIAFYRAIATCSANDGSKGAALTARAEKAGEALLMYYLVLGDNLGITDDAAKSRLLLSAKEMMKNNERHFCHWNNDTEKGGRKSGTQSSSTSGRYFKRANFNVARIKSHDLGRSVRC